MSASHHNIATALGASPSDSARTRRFKLHLSLPGHDIHGDWLCRSTSSALAYQNYCGTSGKELIFTWYTHTDGLDYLQDQEGNWLSWETTANCLYMSYWVNAAAWKLEGGRLIRVKDGAVVGRPEKQRWPLSADHFLIALPPSNEAALTVELVEEPIPPLVKLLEHLTPVVAMRHQPAQALDLYLYTARCAKGVEELATAQSYAGRTASFFALRTPVEGESTVPVYLLHLPSVAPGVTSYRLSLKTQDGDYRLLPENTAAAPNFHAFIVDATDAFLHQVYEHAAPIPHTTQQRYIYDFTPQAHDGWGPGVPIFRAATVEEAHHVLAGSTGAQNARRYATEWIKQNGEGIARLFDKVGKADVSSELLGKYQEQATGMPDIRYVSIGAGLHGGYGLGTVGFESGAIWPLAEFGRVPANTPLAGYSVEWVTFGGATGLDIGGSVDACAVGIWYGDLDQINGACNGVTMTLQFVGGITVNLLWDGTWQGANESAHPIGVTVVMAVGIEAGAGVFYNASATQFWDRRPDFPHI